MPTPPNSIIASYADDTTLICQISANPAMAAKYATRAANALKEYFTRWSLHVNSGKTKALGIFKKIPKIEPQILLEGAPLERVKELTLLGTIFSTRHNFLANLRNRRSILTYGCEVWAEYASKAQWTRLQKCQNKILKAAIGRAASSSTTELKNLVPVVPIKDYCFLKVESFKQKCLNSKLPDIQNFAP
ncbi:hypothetical protein FOCC_FOCC010934 [Frankliniella occidentalis]|nr:hypothetical protein FOCC_FOCC010934 [Frankliniella occidentalis]